MPPQLWPMPLRKESLKASRFMQTSSCALALFMTVWAQVKAKPNVVLILADDLGYGDVSCYNPDSKVATPHIDKLASEGLQFTDAHSAASTCTPSRYGLLTGTNPVRYEIKNTLLKKGDPIIEDHESTLADLFKSQGYATHMIGKWHLGFEMGKNGKYDFSSVLNGGPCDRGFDSYFGIPSSAGTYPLFYIRNRSATETPSLKSSWTRTLANGKPLRQHGLRSPDMDMQDVESKLAQRAAALIQESSKSEKPFFLFYSSTIPHNPWLPSPKWKDKSTLGSYADFLLQIDAIVGQLTSAVEEAGVAENTVIIFTSDNGAGPTATAQMDKFGHPCAGHLRGQKSDLWEGGHRVPFIVKWPQLTTPGSVTDAVINFTDLFATFTAYFKIDSQAHPSAKDSHCFLPVLKNLNNTHTRPAMVHGCYSLRDKNWKLTSIKKLKNPKTLKIDQFYLHDLNDDHQEKVDLSHSHPERKQALFKTLLQFHSQVTQR